MAPPAAMSMRAHGASSRRGRAPCTRDGERGLTLIEVLVAFVVFALVFAGILHALTGSVRSVGVSERYTHAALIARAQLAAAGVESPLEPGVRSGDAGRGYRWTLDVSPYDDEVGSAHALPVDDSSVVLYRLDLLVAWEDVDGSGELRLSSLRARTR